MLRLRRSQAKNQRKLVRKEPSLFLLKESTQLGCVSQDSNLRKSIEREEEKWGSKHAVKFSKSTWHQRKIRERKGPLRGIIPKCEPHERSPCSPKFGEISHEDTLHQERCARKVAVDSAKLFHKLKNADKTTFYSSIEARRMPALTSKSPEEQEFVVDSGATMHMMSKKVLSSDELETHCGGYGQWRSANQRGSTITRSRSWSLRDSAITGRNACCSIASKEGKTIVCKTDNFRNSCRSRVIHQFWKRFVFNVDIAGFISNKSSPRATWRTSFRKLQRITSQNSNPFFFFEKIRNGNRDSDDRLRGLPERLEEFTDDLDHTELHAPAHTSQDSESERPTKVVSKSRKHQIFYSLLEWLKLRSLLSNQNDKGSLHKTHWRSSTSGRKVWWLDDGWWPGGWGFQGMSATGGPNLRVCKHPCHRGGTRRERRANWRPAVVPSSRRREDRAWYGDGSPHISRNAPG